MEQDRVRDKRAAALALTVLSLLVVVTTSLWTFRVQQMPNFAMRVDVAWTITNTGQVVSSGNYVFVQKYGVWKLACRIWKHGGRALGALMYGMSCVWPHAKLVILAGLIVRVWRTRRFDRRFHALTFFGRSAFLDVACCPHDPRRH